MRTRLAAVGFLSLAVGIAGLVMARHASRTSTEAGFPPPLPELIATHATELRSLVEKAAPHLQFEGIRPEDWLRDPTVAADPKVAQHILKWFVSASLMRPGGRSGSMEFIQDQAVVALLVSGAVSDIESLRVLSRKALMRHVRPQSEFVRRWAARLATAPRTWPEFIEWVALSTPDPQGFLRLVEQPSLRLRARLGDIKAERELIAAFQAESKPNEKQRLAMDLGYVGHPETLLALVRELRNPTVVENASMRLSFAHVVTRALGVAFPRESLFHQEYSDLRGSGALQNTEVAAEYQSRVERWIENQLGVTFTEPRPPVPFYSGDDFIYTPYTAHQ